MSFIAELKRRNVFRVGIAYAVTSWLLMQAADLVFPRIGLSDSAVTLVIALLAIGFFPALIFAWAFELTPEGIKKEKDVDRTQSITHVTGRKLDYTIIGILVVALGYFAYDKFVLTEKGSEPFSSAESAAAEGEDGKRALTPFPLAYSHVDKEEKFKEVMSRYKAGLDRQIEMGADNWVLTWSRAHYALLSGDPEGAIAQLDKAVQQGAIFDDGLSGSWSIFSSLRGDPAFEAVRSRMLEHLNKERAELGLAPLSS